MEKLRLEIVTPDSIVLEADVDYVGAPGVNGEFGVLPGHVPLLSALTVGGLYYRQRGEICWVFISGGFAEVADNKVTILAEGAEQAENIDVARAMDAKKRAEERLSAKRENMDTVRASSALARAVGRISTVARLKR